ncbi:uncharacterized protein LACBIDRAFT_330872 [Laccaria bicolor S238N-H82]|uniref:Predicted protein n=1 Tax=Laccaria bicolor (strain S238N-H82 / ATCC MYA-4686) TaxID=486041 RepID=B0DN11_LACBS|nr:uncharacterized protein LACBIDRAFT_330872 [Laccaria bicolor S238N-H82]EDR03971.1 predicted protein [Laccaria bicolor S238N-H82]|eukprot:XP_001885226.1 predicted protein [Laccaria bicolor S238N-H82]
MAFRTITNASQTSTAAGSLSKKDDVQVSDLPTDSISKVSFSSQADYMAVASWDNSVRIYEVGVQESFQTQVKGGYHHQGPVLDVCWSTDGTKLFSGGVDNAGRMYDLITSQTTQVAQHDAAIKSVGWVDTPQGGILVTGSWDKTIKYWDLRTPNPVVTVQLPERCYSFDMDYPLMVVGTAGRHVQIFDLTNPGTPHKTMTSPLKWETRVISCIKASGRKGFAIGSLEGRVAIHHVEEKDSAHNFSFRCHRRDLVPNSKDQSLIYAINDISYHPIHGTVSTCGSDGTVHFWDTDARTRLKSFDIAGNSISTTAFNRDGSIFAYAVSYDWSKGHVVATPGSKNNLVLHRCKNEEVKKRLKK